MAAEPPSSRENRSPWPVTRTPLPWHSSPTEEYARDLGQIAACLNKVETTVEQTDTESAALSRTVAETVQKFQDNSRKQRAVFVAKDYGVLHSGVVVSHTIHSENTCKRCGGNAQDAFDKVRVCHEEKVRNGLRAEDSIQKNT